MPEKVIHTWEDGTVFFTDDNGSYFLRYQGVVSPLMIIRTGIIKLATCSNKEVPKRILDEIAYNM